MLTETDDLLESMRFQNARLIEALNNIADFAGFTRRLFAEVDNPKHLVNALEHIEADAKEATR